MKKIILIASILSCFSVFSQQVLTRTNTASTTNKSWQIYRQNSPGNTYGNSFVLFEANYDSVLNHAGYVKVDILDNRTGYLPSKKYVSADNNGYLKQGSFDSLTFPISQIVNLNTMLLDRPTFSQVASTYQPIGGYLVYSDTTIMLSPYFRTANFNSYFDTRIGAKTTSNLAEGSNLYYTDARVQSFGDTRYLQSEVDGSITNEIEVASQTDQSGKVLSTNGTTTTWITPNSGTVTSVGVSSTTLTIANTPVTSTGTITVNLPSIGTSGTYGIVTTDAYGRITSGKRTETYSGTTNGSGTYTVTFSTPYSVAPNIQANITGGSDTQIIRITSVSTTGFTILVRNRVDVVGLLPTWSNVSGATVDVLITEK